MHTVHIIRCVYVSSFYWPSMKSISSEIYLLIESMARNESLLIHCRSQIIFKILEAPGTSGPKGTVPSTTLLYNFFDHITYRLT